MKRQANDRHYESLLKNAITHLFPYKSETFLIKCFENWIVV